MKLCSRCHKNPAIIYITKMEGNKTTNEGLCLACAKELGIAPINDMIEKMGITDSDIENLNSEMSDFMENIGANPENLEELMQGENPGSAEEGGAHTFPLGFMSSFMPKKENEDKTDKNAKTQKKPHFGKKKSMLDTYGTNLTEMAKSGKVDRVINRNSEIDRVIQILNRRSKNNPVILGEPGVGKTAIAEGLACRIVDEKVPPKLLGYQLYLIDFTALVAGTQFRGQFEARLKNLLIEAEDAGNVILVIDEIHNIVAAGDADGAMSAANILKPALARGEIQIIGATTLNEYRKHIEKDTALERRFQPVLIDEPSISESIEILRGIKDYYEDYHKVTIPDEVLEAACRMSERYITDRFLPDKAIDVIDEASSSVNLKNIPLYEAVKIKQRISEIDAFSQEAANSEDFETVARLKQEKLELEETLKIKESEAKDAVVTLEDVAAVIENWTKIPVHKLTEGETTKLLCLEDRIHKRVIGQNDAVSAVCRAIRRGRADITFKRRPVSFIFAGPTGVGKTELVKTIAEVMFDNEDALIRFDMSEFMEKHSVSKLIGSPPGYVGYDEAGQLTEKVRRKPYSVILLDEIEKAHPEIFNLFLQILDDGRVSDSHGKIVNFENTIIIMTTNAGSEFDSASIGFNSDSAVTLKNNVEKSLKERFRPEFLNRIDEVVTFSPLTKDELKRIVDLMLLDITERMAQKGAKIEITENAKTLILEKGFDIKYGARPLKRAIQTLVEDKLADFSLRNTISEGMHIIADRKGNEIEITVLSLQQKS
ncbi:MAG: AAA family ATPase [Firmicutes bacterium]|nr:AAA family ATPase [Bacillota bacterium]